MNKKVCFTLLTKKLMINITNRAIGLMNRVLAYSLVYRGSISGRVIPKTQKRVLDAPLLNTHKGRIESKVELSRERSSTLPYLGVVAIEKGAFGSPSTKVANFIYNERFAKKKNPKYGNSTSHFLLFHFESGGGIHILYYLALFFGIIGMYPLFDFSFSCVNLKLRYSLKNKMTNITNVLRKKQKQKNS